MKAIVHIGMPKTGSTALQDSLNRSRDGLLAEGVLYPANPGRVGFINHKYIVADLLSHDRLPRHLVRGQDAGTVADKQSEFRKHLVSQVRKTRPRALIISTESLFRTFNKDARDKLAKLFSDLRAEAEVVAWLRKPSAHFASALQQHIKASSIVRPPRIPHYRSVIGGYEMLVGRTQVHLNLFDRAALHEGDIVADFAVKYLAPMGISRRILQSPETTNETLSAESVDILRSFRATFHAEREDLFTPDTNGLILTLADIDARLGSPRPKLVDGLAEVIDYSTTDPLWLRDSHGIVFPGYDYARAERGQLADLPTRDAWQLEDLLQIDFTLRAAIAHELAQTPWCAEDPARVAWAAGLSVTTSGGPASGRAVFASDTLSLRQGTSAMNTPSAQTRKTRKTGKTADKDNAQMLRLVAKAIWKAEQKAANPAISPEALKTGWAAVRKTRIDEARDLLKVVSRAGFQLVKTEQAAKAPDA